MHQIKLFKGVEKELAQLEEEVNQWIRKHREKIKVKEVKGNIAPQAHATPGQEKMSGSDVLIIVEYEF